MKKTSAVAQRKVTRVPETGTLNPAGQDLLAFSVLLDRWNHDHGAGSGGASSLGPAAQVDRGRRLSTSAAPAGKHGRATGSPRSTQVTSRGPASRDDWVLLDRAAARSAAIAQSIKALDAQIDRLRKELEEARRQEKRIAAEAVIQVMRRFRIGQDVVRPLIEGPFESNEFLSSSRHPPESSRVRAGVGV